MYTFDELKKILHTCNQNFRKENADYLVPYDNNKELNEMSMSIKTFKTKVLSFRGNIFDTICNICCLEDVDPEDISHWRNELQTYLIHELFDPTITGGIKKTKAIKKYLIDECVDKRTYEPDSPELFIKAMTIEIKKAERYKGPDKQRKLIIAKQIEMVILPNIDFYYQNNKNRIAIFLKDIITAFDTYNKILLTDSIDNFINYKN